MEGLRVTATWEGNASPSKANQCHLFICTPAGTAAHIMCWCEAAELPYFNTPSDTTHRENTVSQKLRRITSFFLGYLLSVMSVC